MFLIDNKCFTGIVNTYNEYTKLAVKDINTIGFEINDTSDAIKILTKYLNTTDKIKQKVLKSFYKDCNILYYKIIPNTYLHGYDVLFLLNTGTGFKEVKESIAIVNTKTIALIQALLNIKTKFPAQKYYLFTDTSEQINEIGKELLSTVPFKGNNNSYITEFLNTHNETPFIFNKLTRAHCVEIALLDTMVNDKEVFNKILPSFHKLPYAVDKINYGIKNTYDTYYFKTPRAMNVKDLEFNINIDTIHETIGNKMQVSDKEDTLEDAIQSFKNSIDLISME